MYLIQILNHLIKKGNEMKNLICLLILISLYINCEIGSNKDKTSFTEESMNSSEDTITRMGYIVFREHNWKNSLFIPLNRNIVGTDTVDFSLFKSQNFRTGFQFCRSARVFVKA